MIPWCCILLTICNIVINVTIVFFVDSITCLQTARGAHHKFAITLQKCKCSILQIVILQFDRYRRYLYISLIIYFSSIHDSERYMDIVWDSRTSFIKLCAIYCYCYCYGSIYLTYLYLLITIWFPWMNLFTAQ